MKKLTIKDLFDAKGKRQLTEVLVDNADDARACEEAGIDLLVSYGEPAKIVRATAPHTFLTIAINGNTAASEAEALHAGFDALNQGADAIYTGMSIERVRALARERVPVVGHVGLVPYRSSWYGGFRAVGKTAAEALQVYRDTLAYDEAGAIAVEMEVVPHKVAAEISKRVKLLVISMGSGTGCDAQYLFACDILGTHTGHYPRHSKRYRDFHTERQRLYRESVAAFKEYQADVTGGGYPEKKHLVEIPDKEYDRFLNGIDKG